MSKPSGAIDMTQGKPINLMLRFALPMMIGSIFQSLYSMVDSAVLGRCVGAHALAAIGATTSTTGLILLLATGVTSAISIVLSQYVGANDTDRVRKGIVASGWITLLLGVVLGLISIFAARPLMQLLKRRKTSSTCPFYTFRLSAAAASHSLRITPRHLSCAHSATAKHRCISSFCAPF